MIRLAVDPGALSFTLPLFLNDACLSLSLFLFPLPPMAPPCHFFSLHSFPCQRTPSFGSPSSAQGHDKSESFESPQRQEPAFTLFVSQPSLSRLLRITHFFPPANHQIFLPPIRHFPKKIPESALQTQLRGQSRSDRHF